METNVQTARLIARDALGLVRVQVVCPTRLQAIWTEPLDYVTAALFVDFERALMPEWDVSMCINTRRLHEEVEAAYAAAPRRQRPTLGITFPAQASNQPELRLAIRCVRVTFDEPLPRGAYRVATVSPETPAPPAIVPLGPEPMLLPAWLARLILLLAGLADAATAALRRCGRAP